MHPDVKYLYAAQTVIGFTAAHVLGFSVWLGLLLPVATAIIIFIAFFLKHYFGAA